MKPSPYRQKRIAEVERILADNARLLGEEQDVFLRRRRDGSFRVQARANGRWVRGDYKEYPDLATLCWAAGVAHERARQLAVPRRAEQAASVEQP